MYASTILYMYVLHVKYEPQSTITNHQVKNKYYKYKKYWYMYFVES